MPSAVVALHTLQPDIPAPVCAPSKWHLPAFAEAAQRLLRISVPYHVLHANDLLSGWVGLALRLALGVPLVTSFHALGLRSGDTSVRPTIFGPRASASSGPWPSDRTG